MPTSGRLRSRAILTISSLQGPGRRTRSSGPRSTRCRRRRPHQLVGVGSGAVGMTVDQVLTKAGLQAAREHDHPVAMAGELLHVDSRLAALIALQESGRRQLDQVPVTGRISRQQGQVEAVELPRAPRRAVIIDDVGLAADQHPALHPVLAAGREQLHGAVHHPVVGQPQSRLLKRRRAGAASASTLHAPSSNEYSEWTCRWAQLGVIRVRFARRVGSSRAPEAARPPTRCDDDHDSRG